MEFNKNLDLQSISEHLTKQIKEVSETWASQMISFNKQMEKSVEELTKEEEANYEEVSAKLEGKDQKKVTYLLKSLPKEKRESFQKAVEFKKEEKTLEQMKENLKEYEGYLEIAVNLKAEVDKLLKK